MCVCVLYIRSVESTALHKGPNLFQGVLHVQLAQQRLQPVPFAIGMARRAPESSVIENPAMPTVMIGRNH